MKLAPLLIPLLLPSVVAAAAPTLTRLEPAGGTRGTQLDVVAIGTFPKWPAKVWVEGTGVSAEALKDKGKLRITIRDDATPGLRWLRVFDEEGSSPPRPFLVGTLPQFTEIEPNDRVNEAQKFPGDKLVVNGKLGKSGDVDSFALPLKRGQTLVASIDSRKAFGSPMDGVLQVASAAGFVLAQNDDDGGMDPLLVFPVPTDGLYVVRVFAFPATPDSSIRFAGGDAYIYRLTLTTGPFADQVLPASVSKEARELEASGWNLAEKGARLSVDPSANPEVAVAWAPELANALEVPRTAFPTLIETSRESSAKPPQLQPPLVMTGRIDSAADRDVFRLDGKKNTRLRFLIEARKLGSPLDPTLTLEDSSGKVLLELDDSNRGGRDIDATYTPTQDGPLQLRIADLHGRGGPRFLYRMTISPPQPDFSLALAEDRVTIKPGTPSNLKVNINRINGFDRPIQVRVLGLPDSVKVAPVESQPKGDTSKSVTLKFDATTGPLSVPFRVEGTEVGEAKASHLATSAVADIDRPVLDPFLSVLAPPPPPKPKAEEKPKPNAEEKPKPKADDKPRPKVEAKEKGKKAAANEAGEQHWAFQPVRRPRVPNVRDRSRVRNPIDAFVQARLEGEGEKPAPEADRRTLIRRLSFDLIGLPPTPEEVNAFLKDTRANAYELLVDRLLARPEYGERWARHWFDVVRYAESNGYERDGAKPGAWHYRDYVIDALNQDKPFDQFLIEQLAGDEIDGATPESRIATTFLRLGTWDDEPADDKVDRCDQLDDVLGTVATGFLGLTLRCARCHDHKFEPFSQVDYYRMLAVFDPLKRPQVGRTELEWPVCSPSEWKAYQAEIRRTSGLRGALLLGAGVLSPQGLRSIPMGYIWREDGPRAPLTHLLRRGDPTRPADAVEPGVPSVLNAPISGEPRPTEVSTGRRLWLARWMVARENPLTSRVIANRLWQWHFGAALVPSSNDFGTMGEPPTHPELLDWLASELIDQGWKLKSLHRLIVTSDTYRRASAPLTSEPTYAHFPARRLEAEAIRDAILSVSGVLNPAKHGPSVFPFIPQAVLAGQSRPGDGWGTSSKDEAARRSVYVFAKRSLALPELELLDTPDTTSSCERRPQSTTGPQALTFLNGAFINEQAGRMADRLLREVGRANRPRLLDRAFAVTLSRPPRDDEREAVTRFLDNQTRLLTAAKVPDVERRTVASLCLVLLNMNDFVYLK